MEGMGKEKGTESRPVVSGLLTSPKGDGRPCCGLGSIRRSGLRADRN